jgi:hypothetical protein
MPKYRTEKYAIWRACERWRILPSGVNKEWDETHPWFQAHVIAFDQIRQIEDDEKTAMMLKAIYGGKTQVR